MLLPRENGQKTVFATEKWSLKSKTCGKWAQRCFCHGKTGKNHRLPQKIDGSARQFVIFALSDSQIRAKCSSRPANRVNCALLRDNLRVLLCRPRKLEQNAFPDQQIGQIAHFCETICDFCSASLAN